MRTYKRRRPEAQVIEDVQNLCRLCLEKSEEMIPIFLDGSDGICATLSLRIMICVGLEVIREKSLPNVICSKCHKELDRYYKFRKKCEVSYQRLKLHLQTVKENESLENIVVEERNIQEDKIMQISIDVEDNCNLNSEVANEEKTMELETHIHDADNPELSSFLSTVLIQLGVLEQQDSNISIHDPGINNLELMMGDNELVTLELIEEEDDNVEESHLNGKVKPIVLNSMTCDSDKSENNGTQPSDKVDEQVTTLKWKPDSPEPTEPEVVLGGRGAWCGTCRKWFASRGTLRRHARTHTGERPHQCRDCGKRFAQRAVLVRHRLVHLERRPFECAECGKGFTQRGGLRAHARAHAPPHARALHLHACTRCTKVFLAASSLSRHMMKHKGRMYVCSVCDKQFSDKSSLLRHLRNTHTKVPSQALSSQTDDQSQPLSAESQPLSTESLTPDCDTVQAIETQSSPNRQQHSVNTEPVRLETQSNGGEGVG